MSFTVRVIPIRVWIAPRRRYRCAARQAAWIVETRARPPELRFRRGRPWAGWCGAL